MFSQQTNNISVLSFTQHNFGLKALTPLNARQNDFTTAFDFNQVPLHAAKCRKRRSTQWGSADGIRSSLLGCIFCGVWSLQYESTSGTGTEVEDESDNVFSFNGKDYVLGYSTVQALAATPISAYGREDRVSRRDFQILTKLAFIDAATRDGSPDVIEVELGTDPFLFFK